jgi:hypothetical protein
MSQIKATFVKGINTIFSVFNEAVKTGTYDLVVDNGFDTPVPLSCPIRCIFEEFEKQDVHLLSFSDLIQPNDVKGLIPGEDITLAMSTDSGSCTFGTDTYSVEGFVYDPLFVLCTALLRRT